MSLESLAISRHVAQHPVQRFSIGNGREAIDNTIAIMKNILLLNPLLIIMYVVGLNIL